MTNLWNRLKKLWELSGESSLSMRDITHPVYKETPVVIIKKKEDIIKTLNGE